MVWWARILQRGVWRSRVLGTGGGIRALRIGQVGSASWKEVASIAIPGVIRELDASGNHLYVADPLQPIEVRHNEMPGMACS